MTNTSKSSSVTKINEITFHKDALKVLRKTQKKIQDKTIRCIKSLEKSGFQNLPFPIEPLKGEFKKYKYYEIKIDYDFRLVVRQAAGSFYIRYAGTHNQLGTG